MSCSAGRQIIIASRISHWERNKVSMYWKKEEDNITICVSWCFCCMRTTLLVFDVPFIPFCRESPSFPSPFCWKNPPSVNGRIASVTNAKHSRWGSTQRHWIHAENQHISIYNYIMYLLSFPSFYSLMIFFIKKSFHTILVYLK